MAWSVLEKSFIEINNNKKKIRRRTHKKSNLENSIIYDDSDENEEPKFLLTSKVKKRKSYDSLNITNILKNSNITESNEISEDLIELCTGFPDDYNIGDTDTLKPSTSRLKSLELNTANQIQETMKQKILKCRENLENSQQNTINLKASFEITRTFLKCRKNIENSEQNWTNLKKSFNINLPFSNRSQYDHCTKVNSNIIIEDSSTEDENSEPITNNIQIEDVNSSQQTNSQYFCSQLSLRHTIISSPNIESSNNSIKMKKNTQSEIVKNSSSELKLFVTELGRNLLNEKKIRAKKGGLVERLRKTLKSNHSDQKFWKNEIKNGVIQNTNLYCIENIEKSYNNYIFTVNVNNTKTIKLCINVDSKYHHLFSIGYKFRANFDFEPYKINNSLLFVSVNKITDHEQN